MVTRKNSNVIQELLNPLIISSLIMILLLTLNAIQIRSRYFCNVHVDFNSDYLLEGIVSSNAVKTKTDKYYGLDLKTTSLYCCNNGYSDNSKSRIKVLIKKESVEAFFPGKLYSSAKAGQGLICEQTASLKLKGRFIDETTFVCSDAEQLSWENSLFGRFFHQRAKCRLNLKRLMFAWGSAGGLLMALLTGMKEYTESSVADNFKLAGLSHILALSGMHLNLFSGIAKKIELLRLPKIISGITQIIAVLLFVWFAGISPSLLRALLCNILGISVSFMNLKKIKKLHILAIAFLIHISIKPFDFYEISFSLSYGAVAGILLLSELSNFLAANKMPYKLAENLSASIGAQGISAPISLKALGTFSVFGTISTLVVSPLITVFIYLGLALIILCLIFPVLVPLGAFLMKILYNIIRYTVEFFSTLPSINL